jgi:dihydrofolate synthase/folylpolyglutamate synthase
MKSGKSGISVMNYEQAVSFLSEALPMYQRIGHDAYKADLVNALRLDEYFGHEHRLFKTIHVAGTNGKGSVSHMLASVLQHAGYKTGLFTSPHLVDFRERVRVNGSMIEKQFVTEFANRHRAIFNQIQPSFFEMSTFLAFAYFAREKVDVAVIETGLGGRLDTTNIIAPELTIITNIGLDHTQILGNTYEAIAYEKAGIMKKNIPVIIGETQPGIQSVFKTVSDKLHAPLYLADNFYSINYQLVNIEGTVTSYFETCYYWNFKNLVHDLKGYYQKRNIPAVLMALSLLAEKNKIRISSGALQEGMKRVIASTGLMGRWQEITRDPLVICDTAHNAEAFSEIVKQIADIPYRSLFMILGFVQDKDIKSIAQLLPAKAHYYLCEANVPRAMKTEVLAEFFKNENLKFRILPKVADAFHSAMEESSPGDMIYIGGSTFIVADFLVGKKQLNPF